MSTRFMRHNGKHHRIDEGLYLHYPNTCDVHNTTKVNTAHSPWAPRSTAISETRLAASSLGFIAVNYERKGRITFFVQLTPTRVAWQRIEWPSGFDSNWDEDKVQEAIDNFVWVAKCEETRKILPK